jgi:hypothetical protein
VAGDGESSLDASQDGNGDASLPDASEDGDRDTGASDASENADSDSPSFDGGPDAPSEPCYTVPDIECGALTPWNPVGPGDPYLWQRLYKALPIDGADGFAAVLSAPYDPRVARLILAKMNAKTGCFDLGPEIGMQGAATVHTIQRAVSRGGTFAMLLDCYRGESCGKRLFVNGALWVDPFVGAPRPTLIDVDVATDGKVFVVSEETFTADGSTTRTLVERLLSPTREILAERRFPAFQPLVLKAAVLSNGSIALLESEGSLDYVQFQSPQFENTFTWAPASGHRLLTLEPRGTQLGVAGTTNASGLWFGVVNAETGSSVWTRELADPPRDDAGATAIGLGLEVNASGSLNAVVRNSDRTYLLLDISWDSVLTPAPTIGEAGPPFLPSFLSMAVRTQTDGTVLWSSSGKGRYCRP